MPVVAALGAIAIVLGVVVAKTMANDSDPIPAGIGHIHELAVDPADGTLYAGTHTGVFRVSVTGDITRVGESEQDMMGLAVAGPGRFIGSGHPAAGQGGPAHLGLIESTDAARTWQSRSLRGEADFHSLRYRHNAVYGYDSTTGTVMVSTDLATWQRRATVELHSFVVSPTDPNLLLATTPHGLARSIDGGMTWTHAADLAIMLLDWQAVDRLWGVGVTGDVFASSDGGKQWRRQGRVDGNATAIVAHGTQLFVALADTSILRSGDGGATWTVLHQYPG